MLFIITICDTETLFVLGMIKMLKSLYMATRNHASVLKCCSSALDNKPKSSAGRVMN